jgi:hypothetical protein
MRIVFLVPFVFLIIIVLFLGCRTSARVPERWVQIEELSDVVTRATMWRHVRLGTCVLVGTDGGIITLSNDHCF